MRTVSPLKAALATALLGAGLFAAAAPATAEPLAAGGPDTGSYDATMVGVLADTLGTTTVEAVARLDREKTQSGALEHLRDRATVDGAFYDGDRLVVNVEGATAADAARDLGLTPRTAERGEAELISLMTTVRRTVGTQVGEVQTFAPDLAAQQVVVTTEPSASASLVERLSGIDGVRVVDGTTRGIDTTADVVPGQIMDLNPGTNCSLGYPGTTSDGNNVLLTAGHCVEGFPEILDRFGERIGEGVATRFRNGAPSIDMGLMDIDSEDTGVGIVDTRTGQGVAVTGAGKDPVGTAICKAGNTTGWTCGEITSYNVTVNYGGTTLTSGLARATVCTEGGDSGGAYISGNTAQGMTSGGPVGVDCGFNQGDVGSYSFYQPVVDAADYYGVTLTTS
jgi:hypothetical protein